MCPISTIPIKFVLLIANALTIINLAKFYKLSTAPKDVIHETSILGGENNDVDCLYINYYSQ